MIDPRTDQQKTKYFLSQCLLGIVYNPNANWSSGFVKNAALCAAEYTMVNCDKFYLDYKVVPNLHKALKTAKKNKKKYLIYSEVGTVLMYEPKFLLDLYQFVTYNTLNFAGHILDYGNGSFFIHPQYFIIDVNWAFENEIFEIADEENVAWEGCEIERSEENYHDHYTPIWVKGTSNTKQFNGRGRGWNILNKLAQTNAKFLPWNEQIRNAKWFMYPTVKQEATRVKSMIINSYKHDGVYVANTENITTSDIDSIVKKYDNLHTMALPASGAISMIYPYKYKCKKIIWYDSSEDAVDFGNDLKKWDGKNYKEYILSKKYRNIKGDNYLDYVNKELQDLGEEFTDWWNNTKNSVIVIPVNIFDVNSHRKLVNHLSDVPTLINISNITHYYPNQCIFRTHEKAEMLLDFQSKCLTKVSKDNLNFYGMNPYKRVKICGLMSPEDFTNPVFENLPWRNE